MGKPTSCTRAFSTVFENLEGFPMDWKTNPASFVTFVREHQCPSFLEYGEYPFVSADEVKKALKLKAAFTTILDKTQSFLRAGVVGSDLCDIRSNDGQELHARRGRTDGNGEKLRPRLQQRGREGD